MKTYDIYLIDETIAPYYFHKEEQLQRFFSELHNSQFNKTLYKQFEYITNDFPIDQLIEAIENQSLYYRLCTKTSLEIVLFGLDHFPVYVTLFDRQIQFRCDMLHDAEQELFPLLNHFEPFLFVTGLDHADYGWMSSPINFKLDVAK